MLNNIAQDIQKELDIGEQRPDIKFTVFTYEDTFKIHQLYNSYRGENFAEFLYIPPKEEIHENITSDKACYFGAKSLDGELVGVAKIERLGIPSPFFIPPKYEDKKTGRFFGLSGLLVNKRFRRQGIAKTVTTEALKALLKMGASGVYADCDFRNVASFSTLSSVFNFIGYADGRKGADGEKTIYTTFYLSFGDHEKKEIPQTMLDLSFRRSMDDVPSLLQTQMYRMGPFSSYDVQYGGGHNELCVLDERIQTPNITLILDKEKPIRLTKHIIIPRGSEAERVRQ